MKKFSQLVTLLPCHSLEDFPVHGTRADAKSLLAAWTGLWHPQLIADSGKAPTWFRADNTVASEKDAQLHQEQFIQQHYYEDDESTWNDDSDQEFDPVEFENRWRDSLVVIPKPSNEVVFDDFADSATKVNATIVSDVQSRTQLHRDIGLESAIDSQFVAWFFSLGYMRLQIEMMTRKLRYSSDLDCERFDAVVVEAARSALEDDSESCESILQSAFDLLSEEKNRYYPVSADFIDIVMTTEALRIDSIDAELANESPLTFLMTGGTAESIAAKSTQTAATIRDQIENGNVGLIGGASRELPENLLHPESSLNQLLAGEQQYKGAFETKPEVLMRRRFGLNSLTPVMLENLQFTGALHVSLDQGNIPASTSNSIRWVGAEGSAVMALTETPLDASSDKSFLDLGVRIGSELDSAHIATVPFARWPTQTCDSFEDLKNANRFGKLLGEFTDVESWFQNVYDPGYGDSFDAEEYRGPWLKQALSSGSGRPVSMFIDYWCAWYKLSSTRALVAILALRDETDQLSDLVAKLDALQIRVEHCTENWDAPSDIQVEDEIDAVNNELLQRLNCSYVNPVPWKRSAPIRCCVAQGHSGLIRGNGPYKFAAGTEDGVDALIETSGFGQVFSNPDFGSAENAKLTPVDDGESILRNEFFEVRTDPDSGSIRGVHFYGQRGNLLGQRLAVRYFDETKKKHDYSSMVCDRFTVVSKSPIASEVRASGRLIDSTGEVLATFSQVVGVQRGRNVIDISIELDQIKALNGTATNYVANRIAWHDESAELFADIQGMRHPVRSPEIEAPHFVEVIQAENRFALLTHGLPWHQRTTKKNLDSILVVGAEQRRKFKLGIAVNAPTTMQTAVAEMHPALWNPNPNDNESKDAKWWLHLANRNVVVTWIQPLFDGLRCSGVRLRLQETDGVRSTLKLYCKRDIENVELESFRDEFKRSITLERRDGEVPVIEASMSAYDYIQLRIDWSV